MKIIRNVFSMAYASLTSINLLYTLLALILFIASPAWAANWYVSQDGGGAKTGTSFANSWAKNGIVWNRMGAGDTLYIIGVLHGDLQFNVGTNGQPNNYFAISGYDSTSGIVLGYEKLYTLWSGPDAYGAYRLSYNGPIYGLNEWFAASGPLTYTILKNAGKVPDRTWAEGSYYYDSSSHILYWKPVDGSIKNKATTISMSSAIYFNGRSWVKVRNLKSALTRWCIGNNAASDHLWIDNITVKDVAGVGVQILSGSNIRVSHSIISRCTDGLWTYSRGSNTNDDDNYITIDYNTITDMSGGGDSHCIGLQGGNNNVIEYNHLSYCDTGITIYSDDYEYTNNNIIRYNHVHNMEKWRSGVHRGDGITWEGNQTSGSYRTGNFIYYNIIHDCEGIGTNMKFISPLNYVYNNTIRKCSPNYLLSGNGPNHPTAGVFKNNISVDPVPGTFYEHWWYNRYSNGDLSKLTIENNLYYPNGKFRFGGTTYNLSGWKTVLSRARASGAETKSTIGAPLFTNASGSYNLATDFSLQNASPAINKGDNSVWSGKPGIFDFTGTTGITDRTGTIITPGGVVDIGAYEGAMRTLIPPGTPTGLKITNN